MTTNGNGTGGGDLVQVRDLVMHFPVTKGIVFQRQVGAVKAVDGVSFNIKKGETLGLVGESARRPPGARFYSCIGRQPAR